MQRFDRLGIKNPDGEYVKYQDFEAMRETAGRFMEDRNRYQRDNERLRRKYNALYDKQIQIGLIILGGMTIWLLINMLR